MFAIPGLVLLLSFIYVRPQEIVPALQSVPFLYLWVALTAFGAALDLRLGLIRPVRSPLVAFALLHFVWSLVTIVVMAPGTLRTELPLSFLSLFLFLALSQGVQTFRALKIVAGTLLLLSTFLAFVGVHQSAAPLGCVKQYDGDPINKWRAENRPCETRQECAESSLEQNVRFRCERMGLFGTTSFEGRVRWRGIMEDPNELALVTAIAVPLAFGLYQARRSVPRLLVSIAVLGLVAVCVVFTRSRSGQLAFLAMVGTYLFRRLRWGGVAAAAVLAAPVVLLGGRADSAASQSTLERLECWTVALDLFRGSPLLGVGKGQFTEHHELTAHNSMLLAAAEQGLPGLFLWSGAVYLAFKTVWMLLRARLPPEGRIASIWATSLLSSLCALMVSAFFLSFSDHAIFWIYLGAIGALHAAALRHDERLRLTFTARDAGVVLALDGAIMAGVFLYTRVGLG